MISLSAEESIGFVYILSQYSNIIYEFLFELYVFYAIFSFGLTRKKYFALRVAAGIAAMLVIGFGAMTAYHYIGETVWGRVLIYFALFVLSVVHFRTCFNESTWVTLFCCDMAYAVQNLVYKMFLTLWCFLLDIGFGPEVWQYKLMYYTFFAACAVAVYFILARRTRKYMLRRRQDYRTIVISFVILAITLILCSIEDVTFASLSSDRENLFDNQLYYILRQAGNLFSIMCCIVVLAYLSGVLEKRDLEEELRYVQYNVAQMKQQYEISKDTIEQINIKCHDMRHKVRSLLKSGVTEGGIEDELREAINIYDANIRTGNKTLDVILTEKSLVCEKRGIVLSCMVDGEKLDFVREDDLYCLFGNIIDNAAEAVAALPDTEKRVINLTCKAHGDMVLIEEENYYSGELRFEDGLPQTNKEDKMYHGFGVRSIRMIARNYGGEMTARAENGIYYLRVLLSSAHEQV